MEITIFSFIEMWMCIAMFFIDEEVNLGNKW